MSSEAISSVSLSSEDDAVEEGQKEIQDFDSGDEQVDSRPISGPESNVSSERFDSIRVLAIAKECFPGFELLSKESREDETSRSTPVPVSDLFFDSNQEILSNLKSVWESSESKSKFDLSVSRFQMKI